MSANFTGVTFPNQKVTPANDAVIRRAIFDDGILTGCDLSYSGSTLTMTAGQLMICGRQIIHPSSQNWAVTEATSGYARLVLTIDVTRTSTKDTFDQVIGSAGFWSYLDARRTKKSASTRLLIGIAHDRITFLGMKYVERGYITRDEYENLNDYLYEPYTGSGCPGGYPGLPSGSSAERR